MTLNDTKTRQFFPSENGFEPINSYFGPHADWKNGLVQLTKPYNMILAFFRPIIPNFWTDLAFYKQYLDFSYKIYIQDLKLSGKEVLFGSLGPPI